MSIQPLATRTQPPQILQNPTQLFNSIALSYLPYVFSSNNPISPIGSANSANGWNPDFLKAAFSAANIITLAPNLVSYVEQNYKPLHAGLNQNGLATPAGGVADFAVQNVNNNIVYALASGTQVNNFLNGIPTIAQDGQLAFSLSLVPGTPVAQSQANTISFLNSLISTYGQNNIEGVGHSLGGWTLAQAFSSLDINSAQLQTIQSPGDYGVLGNVFDALTFGALSSSATNQNAIFMPDLVPTSGVGSSNLIQCGSFS